MKPTIVIITGLAGSGKTVALRALEDEGFYCVDNLPVTLIESFTSIITASSHHTKVGIGIDIREKEFLHAIDSVLTALRERYNIEIIFLEAEKGALIRRFKETRRPHPLISEGADIERAIDTEMDMLQPLRRAADRIIDTSTYTPHQLRHLIASSYRKGAQKSAMAITLISFGYKFGIPQNIDLLFDVRFIPNPNFVPDLKELKGTDKAVQNFISERPTTKEFIEKTAVLLSFLIPQYISEGKTYLTVGFGCTGGRHRSPAMVQMMADIIRQEHGIEPDIIHRDME